MLTEKKALTLATFILFTLVACKNSGSNQPVLPDSLAASAPAGVGAVQMAYDPAIGGAMSTNDMSLSIPAQATPNAMTMTASRLTSVPAINEENLKAAGVAYNFGPHGTDFDLSKKPVLTVKYDPAVLAAQGISERNLMVYYYDDQSGEYVAEGGEVNTDAKTVTVTLEHFSVYLLAAQQQAALGNTAPSVGAYTCLPSCGATTTRAGAPLYVRSVVTDPDAAGSLVEVTLSYRVAGSPSYTTIPMQIDETLTPVANRYAAVIPAAAVTTAGVQYFVSATDNLNVRTQRAAVTRTPNTMLCSVAINASSLTITAGFRNAFTLSGTAGASCPGATAVANIIPELAGFDLDSATTTGNLGGLKTGSNGIIFDAVKSTPVTPVAKPGTLRLTAGSFVQTATITVKSGTMQSLQILDENSLPFGGNLNITPGYAYNFDVVARDAYGNAIAVLPNWSVIGSIGTITGATTGILDTATGAGNGSVKAVLGSRQATQSVSVVALATAPAGFSAVAGNQKNSLAWTALNGVNGYSIYFTTDGSLPSKTQGTKIVVPGANYEHAGLSNGTSYRYVVTGYNAGGESAESTPVAAVPFDATATYTVTYSANGATAGFAPTDTNAYPAGANAVVMGNPGNLLMNQYGFSGWNTQPGGNGTQLRPGDTLVIGPGGVTLYAQLNLPTYAITYFDSYGLITVADNNRYVTGAQITVPGAGSAVNPGFGFGGWRMNVPGNPEGITYYPGQTLTMGVEDMWLYAYWYPVTHGWWSVCSSADGVKLAAVIQGGQIYTSNDSGITWVARESVRNWTTVACSDDGTKLVAAGPYAQIYTSIDSGVTWTPRESVRWWNSITSSGDGTKLAAVASGEQVYTSTDSGVTWTPHEAARSWKAITGSKDGTMLAAITHQGPIFVSSDSGISWSTRDSTRFWGAITSSADGSKLAAAVGGDTYANGAIYTSTDYGASWTPRTSPYDVWGSLGSSADGTKLVAGRFPHGELYTSSDSGLTWAAKGVYGGWRSMASSADGTKWVAVSYSGWIYTSMDSGQTWTIRF